MSGPREDGLGGDGLTGDDEFEANERLALADEDERLPWLESDDDYEEQGVDTGRVIAFVLVALLALAAILGAGWYFLGDRTSGTAVADGSTIEAPDEPYKTRPEDPGGREVAGTGDMSFAVAEGEHTEARIAPQPAIDLDQSDAEASESSGRVGVQVGAYSSRATAQTGWSELNRRHGEILSGVSHRIVEGTVDGATVYRLQAVAGSESAAESLCDRLKGSGADCQVKR